MYFANRFVGCDNFHVQLPIRYSFLNTLGFKLCFSEAESLYYEINSNTRDRTQRWISGSRSLEVKDHRFWKL